MRILLPKMLRPIDPNYGPVLFYAGPIKGGDDWQHKAVLETKKQLGNPFYAVLPNHYEDDHPLTKLVVKGIDYETLSQLSWERRYLGLASEIGCIIFWLPLESKVKPRTDGNPYAMNTFGELGEWRGRLMRKEQAKVVIGAEKGFPGLSQIQRNFNEALNCKFPIYETLEETIKAAIEKIHKK